MPANATATATETSTSTLTSVDAFLLDTGEAAAYYKRARLVTHLPQAKFLLYDESYRIEFGLLDRSNVCMKYMERPPAARNPTS